MLMDRDMAQVEKDAGAALIGVAASFDEFRLRTRPLWDGTARRGFGFWVDRR
jgi:hypothetical protein